MVKLYKSKLSSIYTWSINSIVLLILCFSFVHEGKAQECSRSSDSLELVKIWNDMNGSFWVRSWDLSQPMNTWAGITLNQDGCVTAIELGSNGLTNIVPELNLPALTSLDMRSNQIRGPLPSFAGLPELTFLRLSNNIITGRMPDISSNTNLVNFRISRNSIQGNVPNWSNNIRLQNVDISDNNLTGDLSSTENLLNLLSLNAANNALSGDLPSFGANNLLQTLNLSDNRFSGRLPVFSTRNTIREIDLSDNVLADNIDFLVYMPSLEEIDLSNNNIFGSIVSFEDVENALVVDYSDNAISGNIPDFSSLNAIQIIDLSGNNLSGNVPAISDRQGLREVYFQNNDLGPRVLGFQSLGNLEVLRLDNNRLESSGLVFSGSPRIGVLQIQNNELSFDDLLPFADRGLQQFTYSPQASITIPADTFIALGEVFAYELGIDADVTNNTYLWTKDGENFISTGTNTLSLGVVTEDDAGDYRCTITNPSLPDLTLRTNVSTFRTSCTPEVLNIVRRRCHGDSTNVLGEFVFRDLVFTDTLRATSSNECDTILRVDVRFSLPPDATTYRTICAGDSALFAGVWHDSPGTYEYNARSFLPCDSVLRLVLDVVPSSEDSIYVSVCAADSIFFLDGDTIRSDGEYLVKRDVGLETCGYDRYFITFDDTVQVTEEIFLCGGSFELDSSTSITTDTTIVVFLGDSSGCDTLQTMVFIANASFDSLRETDLCSGDTIFLADRVITSGGSYDISLPNINPCQDISLVVTEVEVPDTSIAAAVCFGEFVEIGQSRYYEAGSYRVIIPSAKRCDSLVNLEITEQELIEIDIQDTFCVNDGYMFNGVRYERSGNYRDTVFSKTGCDTIARLRLVSAAMVLVNSDINFDVASGLGSIVSTIAGGLPPYSYSWSNGDTTNMILSVPAGDYTLTVTDQLGCSQNFAYVLGETSSTTEIDETQPRIELYPNPNDGQLIKVGLTGLSSVDLDRCKVYNSSGRLVLDVGISDEQLPVISNGSPLPSGIYYISVVLKTGEQLSQILSVQ